MTIKIREWPKERSVNFDDLVNPIVKAIKFAYTIRRKNLSKDIPYDGYERNSMLAGCLPIGEALSVKGLEFDLEDQGRTAIEVIVGLAIQLGIEHGQRLAKAEHKKRMKLFALFLGDDDDD